jgi:hypothetical protein
MRFLHKILAEQQRWYIQKCFDNQLLHPTVASLLVRIFDLNSFHTISPILADTNNPIPRSNGVGSLSYGRNSIGDCKPDTFFPTADKFL